MPTVATWRTPSYQVRSNLGGHLGKFALIGTQQPWSSPTIPKCTHVLKNGNTCRCPALQYHDKCRLHNKTPLEELIARHPGKIVRKRSKLADHIIARRNDRPTQYFYRHDHQIGELPKPVRAEMHRLSAAWQGRILRCWIEERPTFGINHFYRLWESAKEYLDVYPYKPRNK